MSTKTFSSYTNELPDATDLEAAVRLVANDNGTVETVTVGALANRLAELGPIASTESLNATNLNVKNLTSTVTANKTATDKAVSDISTELSTFKATKGAANGLAPLNDSAKIDESILPMSDLVRLLFISSFDEVGTVLQQSSIYYSTDAGCSVVYNTRTNVLVLAVTATNTTTYYSSWRDATLFGDATSAGRRPVTGKLYVCTGEDYAYRWNGTDLERLSDLSELQDSIEGHADAIRNLTTRVEDDETTITTHTTNIATNTANIATNAAAIAALDSQVNDTRHHLIVKTTKDLTIVVDGKYVKIPAKAKTDIFFKSTAYGIPYASHVVCHFQLLNTSGMTMYPCIYSNKVSHIDVRDWDMSKVTSIYRQFNLCSRIHDLDVSGWDTSRISEMEGSFWGCSSLTTLDVSGWDTSKVVHMNRIFEGCSSLTTLDVSGWDTGAVTNMLRTFFGCSSLTTLDLTNWDTTSTTNFSELFSGCLALANLTLGALFFATKTSTTISFASLSKWTNDTVRTSLVTNLYDRAANGLGTITLQLHANTKAVLSTEDKEYITSKGYIIA